MTFDLVWSWTVLVHGSGIFRKRCTGCNSIGQRDLVIEKEHKLWIQCHKVIEWLLAADDLRQSGFSTYNVTVILHTTYLTSCGINTCIPCKRYNDLVWTVCQPSCESQTLHSDNFDQHSKRTHLVTDSCSAEWQCFSCAVYKLAYLLIYLLIGCDIWILLSLLENAYSFHTILVILRFWHRDVQLTVRYCSFTESAPWMNKDYRLHSDELLHLPISPICHANEISNDGFH